MVHQNGPSTHQTSDKSETQNMEHLCSYWLSACNIPVSFTKYFFPVLSSSLVMSCVSVSVALGDTPVAE